MAIRRIRQMGDRDYISYKVGQSEPQEYHALSAFALYFCLSAWFVWRWVWFPWWLAIPVGIYCGIRGFQKPPQYASHLFELFCLFLLVSWIYPFCWFWWTPPYDFVFGPTGFIPLWSEATAQKMVNNTTTLFVK